VRNFIGLSQWGLEVAHLNPQARDSYDRFWPEGAVDPGCIGVSAETNLRSYFKCCAGAPDVGFWPGAVRVRPISSGAKGKIGVVFTLSIKSESV
jgi:hypothetical protein